MQRMNFILGLSIIIASHAVCSESRYTDLNNLGDLSLEELLSIKVTTVSRQPEKLSESPSAIQVITADQIRRSGATSIPEALRLASNLNVAQQNSHEWVISARGFSSDVGNKLLVMIDGRTVYTPLYSGVFWDRQNYLLEDIDRIEVVSGPGATLWGANAVNGVINIITKSSKDTTGGFVELGAGTTLKNLAGLRYGGQLNNSNTTYRAYAKYFNRGEEFLSDGTSGVDEWHMGQTGFRMDGETNKNNQWTIQGDYYNNSSDTNLNENTKTKGGNILARWSHTVSETSDFDLQFYFDQTQLELPVAAYVINDLQLAPAGNLRDQLDTVDIDFQHRFLAGEMQEFIWGMSYRYTNDQVENAPALGFYPEHLEQDLISAFIQDEITLIENKISLTLGTKIENNDYTGTEWGPSARLQWLLSNNSVLWTAISRAVRAPSRIDRDFSLPSTTAPLIILQGSSNFDSEKVTAYELGYRGHIAEQYFISVAAFYNEYTDVRSTSATPDTFVPLYFENNLEGETHGVEINTSIQAKPWWTLIVGYNYLVEDIRVKDGAFDINNALNETSDPKNQFLLNSSMSLGSAWEIDLGLRWVDKLPTDVDGEAVYVPNYGEVNLRIGWHYNSKLDFSLVGQNLLHDHHQEFGEPGPNQEEVGRNIFGKLQWYF